jgi:hypothetical protein
LLNARIEDHFCYGNYVLRQSAVAHRVFGHEVKQRRISKIVAPNNTTC